MAHDDALHQRAVERGDYADEALFENDAISASLIHFGDSSHGVRLDLADRGLSLVVDTPAWLDLDTVLFEVSAEEPTLGSGYATVERDQDENDGEVSYRVTIQGGDVVGRISLILLDEEVQQFKQALESSREAVEAADTLDHEEQIPALRTLQDS